MATSRGPPARLWAWPLQRSPVSAVLRQEKTVLTSDTGIRLPDFRFLTRIVRSGMMGVALMKDNIMRFGGELLTRQRV